MDILLDTIRGEIAVCLEKAYEKISLKEAARMLYLPNVQAIKEYGAKVSNINYHLYCIIKYFYNPNGC